MFLGKSQEKFVDAQFLLGVIAFKENQLKDAIELVSMAIKARPTVGEYYKILGDILLADKRSEEAISVYREGHKNDISNILLEQNDRLVCLVNKKDIKQIEDLFE